MSSAFPPPDRSYPQATPLMADYNQQYYPPQGGPPPQGYPPNSQYNPGGSEPYAQQYQPPPQSGNYGYSEKNVEYERFKPKKRINDPIFLVLFLAQVRANRCSRV